MVDVGTNPPPKIPRRVEMGWQEPNYTTATSESPVEIPEDNQTHASTTEAHDPSV